MLTPPPPRGPAIGLAWPGLNFPPRAVRTPRCGDATSCPENVKHRLPTPAGPLLAYTRPFSPTWLMARNSSSVLPRRQPTRASESTWPQADRLATICKETRQGPPHPSEHGRGFAQRPSRGQVRPKSQGIRCGLGGLGQRGGPTCLDSRAHAGAPCYPHLTEYWRLRAKRRGSSLASHSSGYSPWRPHWLS